MIIGIGLLTLVIFVVGVFFLSKDDNPSSISKFNQTQTIDTKLLIRDDSYRIGTPSAKVTVVEFLDFECEACGAAYPTVKRILKDYEGKINYVVRYFPLHNNSLYAIRSVEAAGRHDKYWQMYDKLFENQKEWAEKTEPQTELFIKYAKEIGLDTDSFKQDIDNKALDEKSNRDKADGIEAGVKGTPTFFINGILAGNVMSYDEFKSKIDTELNK